MKNDELRKKNDDVVQRYVCLAPLDHSGDHRIYPVGAVVTLEHLAPEMVQRLVDGGHVRPAAE